MMHGMSAKAILDGQCFLFQQLVRCLSSLIHGPTSTKLMWIFHLYDVDGDGVIDKSEMIKVVHAIYDLLGKHTDPPYDDVSVQNHMEAVFRVRLSFYSGDINKLFIATLMALLFAYSLILSFLISVLIFLVFIAVKLLLSREGIP